MSVEKLEWDQEWAIVKNRYGKLLTYNIGRYNSGYANLTYQGYITKMLETKQYDVFIDAGAYIGLFSQVASFNCKKVIAIEAHPFYYGILLYNMRFLENVVCCYNWVGDVLDTPKINEDLASLINPTTGVKEYMIDVISLDKEIILAKETKMLIKLDVEGNDIAALYGALHLTKNPNIHWVIDVHTQYGVELEKVKQFFKGRKMKLFGKKVLVVEELE